MTWPNLLLALHILGAVAWVGGMLYALAVLRPALAVLEAGPRLALHVETLRRFFRVVWHVMPLSLLSGYALLFGVYGGFGYTGWNVHVMNLLALVMAAVFLYVVVGPWRDLTRAMAGDMSGKAGAGAPAAVARIRQLITLNLALGTLTVVVACLNG